MRESAIVLLGTQFESIGVACLRKCWPITGGTPYRMEARVGMPWNRALRRLGALVAIEQISAAA